MRIPVEITWQLEAVPSESSDDFKIIVIGDLLPIRGLIAANIQPLRR